MISGEMLLHLLEGVVLTYTAAYLLTNTVLILLAFQPVLDQVRGRGFEDLDLMDDEDSNIPCIAIIVPGYNEELTIVETVLSLTAVDYPELELIVVNDGSTDGTRRVMREAFGMRRRDLALREEIPTAKVRANYEATRNVPSNVSRLVMIDKENGGRADGLNAGLNACTSPYFLTIDADCILDPQALKQLVRNFQNDPSVVATGGQVGVVNDSEIRNGRVEKVAVPKGYVPLCQTIEYMRAFSLMRTGFSRLNALPILSGAFMVFRHEVAMEVGGFLTGRSTSRLLDEYSGRGASTICEDMEMILRTHRLMREQGRHAKIMHSALPVVWTEVPPNLDSLGKQRRRWHRGLIEILSHQRRMFLDPRYGRIGLFSLPYFVWFELMGPYIEAAGLFLIPVLALLGWLDPINAALITAFALGAGMVQSILSVLVSTWMEPASLGGRRMRSLLGADRWSDRLRLLAGCFLSEVGFRQLTVIWRLHATIEYFQGYSGWDKFERQGFKTADSSASILAALLAGAIVLGTATPAHAEESPWNRTAVVVAGQEQRGHEKVSWWTEGVAVWKHESRRSHWGGAYQIERDGVVDTGIIVGSAPSKFEWGGFGVELRAAPWSDFSARWVWSAECEAGLTKRWTVSSKLRHAYYPELTSTTFQLGGVVYLQRDWWWSNHLQWIHSDFELGLDDDLLGYVSRLSLKNGDTEVRLLFQRGGESYEITRGQQAGEIRATLFGAQLRLPLTPGWKALGGVDQRLPERGDGNLYLHLGVERGF